MDELAQALLFCFLFVVVVFALLYFSYTAGALDPIIGRITIYMLRAKAVAQQQKLQLQGLTPGKDFVPSELPGNKQARQVVDGVGTTGGAVGDTVGSSVGNTLGLKKML